MPLPALEKVSYICGETKSVINHQKPVCGSGACQKAQECFKYAVTRSPRQNGLREIWWEEWGIEYATKRIECTMALLEYIKYMKDLNYDAIYVIGEVSGLSSKWERRGLADAVAITASIRGMRIVNLNSRAIEEGNWLRNTVFTLVEDRDLRCGAGNFDMPLRNKKIHAPVILTNDATRGKLFERSTTSHWAFWDKTPRPTTINVPRTKRRTAMIVGPGPSLSDMSFEQWDVIRQHTEVWGLNEIFPHHFLSPHFWHLEVEEGDDRFFNHGNHCTVDRFKNGTILVMDKESRGLIDDYPCLVAMPKRGYDRTEYSLHGKCHCTPGDARYRPKGDSVNVDCCVSMNRVMSLFSRLGYEKVYLLGLDGHGGYFYQKPHYNITWDRDKLEDRSTTFARHPSMDTGTNHWVWSFGMYNGMGLVNLAEGGNMRHVMYTQSIESFVDDLVHGCDHNVGPS